MLTFEEHLEIRKMLEDVSLGDRLVTHSKKFLAARKNMEDLHKLIENLQEVAKGEDEELDERTNSVR